MCNCTHCFATPIQMADLDADFEPDHETFTYGGAFLHCRIRAFEHTCKGYLHSDFESWSYPAEWHFLRDERKAELQVAFKERLGLDVYKVLPGQAGNSNSGNTSRKAFANFEVFADIVGCPPEYLEKLAVLLNAANSTKEIDPVKCEAMQKEVVALFRKAGLSWNWLSQSLHTLLFHLHQQIAFLPTAPGYWSEEGAETNHKLERHRRMHGARKISIEANMEDVFVMQACAAYPPVLDYLRKPFLAKRKKEKPSELLRSLYLYPDEEQTFDTLETELDRELDKKMDSGIMDDDMDSEVDLGEDTFVPYPDSDIESDSDYDVALVAESDDDDDEYETLDTLETELERKMDKKMDAGMDNDMNSKVDLWEDTFVSSPDSLVAESDDDNELFFLNDLK